KVRLFSCSCFSSCQAWFLSALFAPGLARRRCLLPTARRQPARRAHVRYAIIAACDPEALERLYGLQNLLRMARHLDATPFAHEFAVGADEEGRALDASHLLAIHVLHLDHPEA